MKNNNFNLYFIIAFVFAIILFSCKKKLPTPEGEAIEEFFEEENEIKVDSIINDSIRSEAIKDSLHRWEIFNDFLISQVINEPNEELDTIIANKEDPIIDPESRDTISCETRTVKISQNIDEPLLYQPDVILGLLFDGKSIRDGSYRVLPFKRAPMTIYTDISFVDGQVSEVIEDPKSSTIQDGINRLINRSETGTVSAKINSRIKSVYSENHLNLIIKANYKNPFAKFEGSFNFSNSNIKSRFILEFTQVYYSVSMDIPYNPSEFFAEIPNESLLGPFSPVYVQSVKFGRRVMYTIESTQDEATMKIALEAAFKTIGSRGEVGANSDQRKMINDSQVNLVVTGGNATDANYILDDKIDGIYNYITNNGEWGKESPGVPLSYTLMYLRDNSIARINLTSEYNIRECELLPNNCPTFPKYTSAYGGRGGEEFEYRYDPCTEIDWIDVYASDNVIHGFQIQGTRENALVIDKIGGTDIGDLKPRIVLDGKRKIKKVTGTYEDNENAGRVFSLQFHFNEGQPTDIFGNKNRGKRFEIPIDGDLAGITGRSGVDIDRIGFIYYTH